MRSIYCMLMVVLFIVSCQKDDSTKRSASEYFPNSVGNYWRYKYVDSILNKSVWVDVSIVGNATLPGGINAKMWIFQYPTHIDTSFVYQVGDTIKSVSPGLSVRNTYLLPLQLNRQWRTNQDYLFDSTGVVENRQYILNNQSFDNSFLLQEAGHSPNARWSSSEWFCPNVGMVSRTEHDAFLIANTNTVFHWELIDYDLK